MPSLRQSTSVLLFQFTAHNRVRYLSRVASSKYARSKPSALGKRRRDARHGDPSNSQTTSKRIDGAVGLRRREGAKEGARERSISASRLADRTEDSGFMAERRKMAAEFAEMRREEKRLFPSPGSQINNPKPKPSLPGRSSQISPSFSTSPSTLSTSTSNEPQLSTPKMKSPTWKSSQQPAKSSPTNSLHIPIILEHPDFICINKPPSLLSQPGLPGEGTILTLLKYQRPDLTLQTVNRYYFPPSIRLPFFSK
jgi:hypothetical protein